jgi:ribosomal protein S18 acetylase RimI-like enzyme
MEAAHVRPVLKSDLAQLMALDHSSTSDHVWQLELRREVRGPQVSATFREVRLPRPVALVYPNDPYALADEWKNKAMMWVAVAGNDAVGYLALTEPRSATGWITDVAVAPNWRRKGVASLLFDAAHAWCKERSNRKIFFEMQSKNFPAIALAQKQSYEFCGYNDQYYSSQDIALIFVRTL